MREAPLAVFVVCWLVLHCSSQREGETATAGRENSGGGIVRSASKGQQTNGRVIPGHEYWFFHSLGLLYDVTETDGTLSGLYQDIHGAVPFTVSKEAVEDTGARTQGTVRAVRRLIVTIERSRHPEQARQMKERLVSLAGETFGDIADWRAWFDENKDYLFWSEEKGRLVVDAEAKEKGIPAIEYRRREEQSAWR